MATGLLPPCVEGFEAITVPKSKRICPILQSIKATAPLSFLP
jgi:hypothetical protein